MAFDGVEVKKGRRRDFKMMLQLCLLYAVAPTCAGAATRSMVSVNGDTLMYVYTAQLRSIVRVNDET